MPTVTNQPVEQTSSGLRSSFSSLFNFLGKILSVSLKYEKFELSDQESDLLGEQADGVVLEFAPQIGGKYPKLIIFMTTLLSIFGYKFVGYAKEVEKKEKLKREAENNKKAEQSNVVSSGF